MGLKIHGLVTGELAGTMDILMLNSGACPGGEPPRAYGYSAKIEWHAGKKAPGVRQPVPIWYIEGTRQKILVDTSFDSADNVKAVLDAYGINAFCRREPEWEIGNALAKVGVRPEEIDVVILTHLHFDHVGNNELFTKAKFIVERDELAWALSPPPFGVFYYPEFAHHVANVRTQILAVDGDVRIEPGVEIWKVGGHSPGSLAVAVETDRGKVVLAGDNIYDYVNLKNHWPIGVFWRLDQVLGAYDRFEREADIIVPNHDWRVWEVYPGGVIG